MNTTGVRFGCSSTPHPIFGNSYRIAVNPNFSSSMPVSSISPSPARSWFEIYRSTSESCLRDEFSTYGQVAEVKLVVDEATKRSKGYAFIQYTCRDDAILALEAWITSYRSRWFNTFIAHFMFQYLDGRLVFVELTKPGRDTFGGYLKTCGPSPQEKIPVLSKRKKKEKIFVTKQEEEASE